MQFNCRMKKYMMTDGNYYYILRRYYYQNNQIDVDCILKTVYFLFTLTRNIKIQQNGNLALNI